ncbi:MAG: tetratricopeptide repeat protein [Ramlibacter sp.]|nr:tetratricopeptide repeat protein [Ramlibacter sp.]
MRYFPALFIQVLISSAALAAGGDGGSAGGADGATGAKADPQYSQAVALIQAHEYAKAIPLLNAYVSRAGNDADAYNYLGYASRKSGDVQSAFTYYNKALAINPKHRGVHEYIGEAYLMTGNLPKAEEHLKVLDGLCRFSCEEYRDLKASIASYKSKQTAAK